MSDIQIIIQDQEEISLEVQSDSEGVTEVSVSAPVSVEVVQNAVFNFSTGDGETVPGATVLDELNDVQVGSSALQGQVLYYDVTAGKYLKGDYDDIAGIPDLNVLLPQGGLDDQFLKVVPGDPTTYEWDYVEKLHLPVKNTTGTAIPAGSAVYASGIQGNDILIGLASASSSSTMPAIGIVLEEILDGASGEIITAGSYNKTISGFSGLSVGDTIYVSETAGELTNSKPQGTALIQNIGVLLQTNQSPNGTKIQKMKVSAIDRVNDIPNLPEGYVWYGDVNGVAQATDLSTIVPPAIWTKDGTIVYYNDGNVGIGTATPSEKLHVDGNIFMSEGSQLRSQTTDPTAGAQAQSLEFFLPYRTDGVTMAENRSALKLGGVKFFEPRTTNRSYLHVFQGLNLASTNGAQGSLSLNFGPTPAAGEYATANVTFGWARVGNTGNRNLQLYGYLGTEFSTNTSGNTTPHSVINDTGLALGHTSPTAPIDIEAAANTWHIKADEYGYVGWKGGATQYFRGWSGRITAVFGSTEKFRITSGGVAIGQGIGDPDARLKIKAAGDDNTTTSILVNNSSDVEMFKVVDDGTVHTKDIKIADTKSVGADGGETINFVKYSGSGVVTFQSDASSNFEFGGGVLVENNSGLIFSDTVAGVNKLGAGTHEVFNFGKNGSGQANYTFTDEVCDVRFENTCDVVFANSGDVVFGSLIVGTNQSCPSLEVDSTRLMYRHSNDCAETEAVVIDKGGVISQNTLNGVAVTIGGSIELRRSGQQNPRLTTNDGFVMSGFFDWNTVTGTNANNNGGGLHLGGDQSQLVSIVSMNRDAYFGALNSAGSRLYIGNVIGTPAPSKTGDRWDQAQSVFLMNTQKFNVRYGGQANNGSGDYSIILHDSNITGDEDGATHGLQFTGVPNLPGNQPGAVGTQAGYTATNGSGDLVAFDTIRSYVRVGSVIYVQDQYTGANQIKTPGTITRHVVTAKDTVTNTITVDPVFSGTTGDVGVFVQNNVATFRDFAGDPIMRVQGNKNVAIGMNDSPERLSITGRIHLEDDITGKNVYIGSGFSTPAAAAYNVVIGSDTFTNATTALANTVIGRSAGQQSTTGSANVFIGFESGKLSTTASYNVYIGQQAGSSNTTGEYNVAIGYAAQQNFGAGGTGGQQSTAVGYFAGRDATGTHTVFGYNAGATIGQGAVMLGYSAGAGSTTTVDTVVGQESYRNVTTGSKNIAVGHQVMWANETGKSLVSNIGVGNGAMYYAHGSDFNVAIGDSALRGYAGDTSQNQVTTNRNVAIGERSMYNAWTLADKNVFIGYRAAFSNAGGGQETNTYTENVGIGNEAGYDIESGEGNVMVGNRSGFALTTGNKNVLLGYNAGGQMTTGSNKLYIANSDTTTPLIYGDFVEGQTAAQNGNGYDGQTGNVGIGKVPTDATTKFEVAVDQMNPDSSFRIKSLHQDGRFQLLGKANTTEQNIAYVWHTGKIGLGETTGGTSAGGSEGAIGLTNDGRVYMTPGKAFSFATSQIGPLNTQIPFQILPAADNSQTLIRSFISASEGSNTAAGFKYQAQYHHFTVGDTSGQGSVAAPIDAVPGTEGLYIASDGDVGIGTTSPSEQLHVVGKIKLDDGQGGGYTLPSADGAPNYVLKTDGSGTVTWQADDAGTGGGASTIGALTDVESTMGATGEILQVDSAGTALEYIDGIDGITYSNNLGAMPEAVGGFPVGTTFPSATPRSLQYMFDNLLYPYQTPVITVTTNLASTYEYGTTVSSATVSVSVTNQSNINGNYTLIRRNADGTNTTLVPSGTLAQINGYVDTPGQPFDPNPNQFIRYRVEATDAQGTTIADNSPNVTWRYRMFWGNSTSPSETSVLNLTGTNNSTLDSDRKGVRNFDAGTGVYKYIAIATSPVSQGVPPAAPNGFKLANGTDVPMATPSSPVPFTGASSTSNGYNMKPITNTVNGKSVSYFLFRSENQLNASLTIEVF